MIDAELTRPAVPKWCVLPVPGWNYSRGGPVRAGRDNAHARPDVPFPEPRPRPTNVRVETALYKFGSLLREKWCLIPADGFYEWKAEGKKKVPQRFTLTSGEPFTGLWDVWGTAKEKLVTCCLVTTAANEVVRPFHDRMPVILPRESYAEWLDPDTPEDRLVALLKPYPAAEMRVTEAGMAVNSPKNDGPECLSAA